VPGPTGDTGAEGLNIWSTATAINNTVGGTQAAVTPVAVTGRTIKVGDLVVSSAAGSLGVYGRVTAVASQTSVTVTTIASIRGATGTNGTNGATGNTGPPGQWTQLTQAQYNALNPPVAGTLYVIVG